MKKFNWSDKDPAGYASGQVFAENKESAINQILEQTGFKVGKIRYFWQNNQGKPVLAEKSFNVEEC